MKQPHPGGEKIRASARGDKLISSGGKLMPGKAKAGNVGTCGPCNEN